MRVGGGVSEDGVRVGGGMPEDGERVGDLRVGGSVPGEGVVGVPGDAPQEKM